MLKTKIIFVIGGLFSGIGKGIVAASLGNLFKHNGQTIALQKQDPYLNIDAGLMNPLEHGEVFMTNDGMETDLDLGTYERFTDQNMNHRSISTFGKVLYKVFSKERKMLYGGKTINFHDVENQIIEEIEELCIQEKPDVLVIEIGGNINDQNIFPYLNAARTIFWKHGKENIFFLFLTYLTVFANTGEFKTRSAQHSVEILRSHSIQPNLVLFRSHIKPPPHVFEKLKRSCRLKEEEIAVLTDTDNVYNVPLSLTKNNVFQKILKDFGWKLNLQNNDWKQFIQNFDQVKKKSPTVKIAVINKYKNFFLSYVSLFESLRLAAQTLNFNFEYQEINPKTIEQNPHLLKTLSKYNGILIAPGFGEKGFLGKVMAAQYAREKKIPTLGICFGLQAMIVEFARNKLNISNAYSEEFGSKKDKKHSFLIQYYDSENLKMLKGSLPVRLLPGSLTFESFKKHDKKNGNQIINERHRHRFVFNSEYLSIFEKNGFMATGIAMNDKKHIEILELKNHPFYVGTQFHPEYKTRALKPHPIFITFLEKCIKFM